MAERRGVDLDVVRLFETIIAVANDSAGLAEALEHGLRSVCEATGWPVGHAFLVIEDRLEPSMIWHLADAERFATFREVTESVSFVFGEGEGPLRRAARTGEPQWLVDVTREPDFRRARLAPDIEVRGAFAFPVLVGHEVVAVLEFYSDEPAAPDEALLGVMRHVGVQLGRVFERQQVIETERRALEAERSYLRIAAHEIRNPLATASGYVDYLLDFADLSEEERREALRAVRGEMVRLGTITRSFLVESRLHAGSMQAHLEPTDVAKVLRAAVSDVPQVDGQVEVHADDGLIAEADPFLLRQAIVNLLTNAERYGSPPIVVEAQEVGSSVEVSIADHGAGVPAEFVPRLFERFARAQDDGMGAGIGLEIVRSLVTLQGGEVGYEPNEPRGARFAITLPQEG